MTRRLISKMYVLIKTLIFLLHHFSSKLYLNPGKRLSGNAV